LNPYFRSAKSATIAALLQHERLSRSELAEITGVSPASITEVSQNLLQQGLLVELPLPQTGKRRGRPSVQLRLQASHSYFVGISISETLRQWLLPIYRVTSWCDRRSHSAKHRLELTVAIRNNYAIILRDAAIPRSRVRGVGITVAGIVDSGLGVCRYLAALNWRDVPVSEMIGKALKLPAWVANDANAVAVGEKFFGRARDYLNFTSIVLGRTIGSPLHAWHALSWA
jgi:hypothetical protein